MREKEKNNLFSFIVSTKTYGKVELKICPTGFIKTNYWCQAIMDARNAFKMQIPIYGNAGFLDLPNLIVEGLYLLEKELEDGDKRRKS